MSAMFQPPADPARFGRVAVVVNPGSGGVDARSAGRLQALLLAHGIDAAVHLAAAKGLDEALDLALAEGPDTLVVLGGDGTLARAADRCGPGGPRLMALPGGTMNMLAQVLNGRRAWPEALVALLHAGRSVQASAGSVGGRRFYVNAILGSPALLAGAREAVRSGKLTLAWLRFRRAWLRAFKGRLRFVLDTGTRGKAGALSLICPLISRELRAQEGLEAAVLDPRGAFDVFRLGIGALMGAWRRDPAVRVQVVRKGTAWARGRLPAVLDGELHRLDSPVAIAFVPDAFNAWVAADAPGFATPDVERETSEPRAMIPEVAPAPAA